ncbi:hypothetical protein SARC_14505 [Sphaeroforma arctica JP610]|uniref:Small EDRK-rich factor-like N-terminal domain-containing protein n=1 Tax=Sphaeroforma arctica JP610 TaxID=667725 RepID=A0A0L0F890_9EUKA|nr:hypothetical protein SARC_14505 [Sphaeroforma arctica JP610]KNC72935.1 hypothetical protein SARC_14505 [Sphaeroforma arctica JP610]|eukprot:XP_014146837.1 hypothetical protein SARC_14505 [Sphaeroforma arctica JP610]
MARGQQKVQAQQKAAAKAAGKNKKNTGPHARQVAEKSMQFKCKVCMMMIQSAVTYKEHFESKHPKADLPDELKEV